jgi:hypothetical protein
MRTFSLLVPTAVVAFSSLAGCHVEVGTDEPVHHPHNQPPPPPANGQPTTVMSNAGKPVKVTGGGAANPTPTPVTPAPTTGGAIVTSSTPFGNNAQSTTGFKGSIYFIPAGTTTIPNLSGMTPSGFLFTPTLNIPSQQFSAGFPGVNTQSQNFAIRYVAPLTVTTESDYDFRLNADDGAVLSIDNTTIVDDNGVHTTATTNHGPVHLVAGVHAIQVDYFQTTGGITLQLFCTKSGSKETVCPTALP